MAKFIDTRGNSTLGIGICDRCRRKFPLHVLQPDRNTPGLRVCAADNDEYDPYRLPALQDDHINLPFVRPDEDIAVPVPPVVYDPFRVTQDDEYRTTQDDDYRTTESDN